MRVGVDVIEFEVEPKISLQRDQILTMLIQLGSYESGLRRPEMTRQECYAGQMILRYGGEEAWIRHGELHVLNLVISDAAYTGASDEKNGKVEFRNSGKAVYSQVAGLVAALNAETTTGLPSGRSFLDSLAQPLAVAQVDGAARRSSLRSYRGGLSPAHLRKVTEWVRSHMEEELTLRRMAQLVGLSISHFSKMFCKSIGEAPQSFVLRQKIGGGEEMLHKAEGELAGEARVLDIAIACGFKTQQHFARVFRGLCGISPTEYRQEQQESERSDLVAGVQTHPLAAM